MSPAVDLPVLPAESLGQITAFDVTPEIGALLALLGAPPAPRAPDGLALATIWADLRLVGAGLGRAWQSAPSPDLWAAHAVALTRFRSGERGGRGPHLLALKRELTRRSASPCHLCAWHCGARRGEGEAGPCGSAGRTWMTAPVLLEGEEFGPGIALSPSGCNAACRFCYTHRTISSRFGAETTPGRAAAAIARAERNGASHQIWIGGNPDQHLQFVLDTLARCRAALPVVWTANGGASQETMALLDGVVAGYVLTLRFGDGPCAAKLGAPLLALSTCAATITAAVATGDPVIVRVLALPGHLACCVHPILAGLATQQAPNLAVNLMDYQYEPAWQARRLPGLARVLSPEERQIIDGWVAAFGLRRIDGTPTSSPPVEGTPNE